MRRDNVVAGSDDVGWCAVMEDCDSVAANFTGNMAHSCITGVWSQAAQSGATCQQMTDFQAWKNSAIGVFTSGAASVRAQRLALTDNYVGISMWYAFVGTLSVFVGFVLLSVCSAAQSVG